jgi:hypothetical protein
MLMLLCVQVVQTNNNESSWRKKIKTTFYYKQAKNMKVCQKQNLIDNIYTSKIQYRLSH